MSAREEDAPSEVSDSPSSEDTPTPEEDSFTSGDSPQGLVQGEVTREVTREATGATDTKGKESKKTTAKQVIGSVKWFNVQNGYGFIRTQDTREHVFIHQSAITQDNAYKYQPSAGDGEMAEFDVLRSLQGTEAAKVTGPGGTPVQGSCHASKRHGVRRSSYLCCQVPSRGHLGSHQEEADRDNTDGRHRQHSGFFMSPGTHSPGPWGVGDRGVDGSPATTADHPSTPRGLSIRRPAPPYGPRSSDDQDGDKDTTDQRRGFRFRYLVPFRHPESPQGHEPGRDGALASERPEYRSNTAMRLRATPAGLRCSEDQKWAKDAAAQRPYFHRGSSIRHRMPPHGPTVAQAQKKETHQEQEDCFATAQGPRRRLPDNRVGQQVRRLPPLQGASAIACRPFPSSGLRAAHLPGCTLTIGPESAPRREPGPCYDLLSRPRGRSAVSRPRFSPHTSEKPRAKDTEGLCDAGSARNRPLQRYLVTAPKELHCRPQAPPPEAQVHKPQGREGEHETGTADTHAQPREKPSTGNEDPTTTLAQ